MEGICNCGSVSFTLSGDIPGMYQCHCSLCQKQSGAGSNASTIVKLENFKWNYGVEFVKQWQKESGFSSHFCQNCGSPVPNSVGTKYMWIPIGLVSGADSEIVAHLCLSSKSSWDSPIETPRTYQEMPEDLEEFVQYLHSSKNA